MKRISGSGRGWVRSFVVALVVLGGCGATWAHPVKGSVAPTLGLVKLLQAPVGAKADWASLKGKVVVVDFWATWCSPCVASLPHLNELVGSLDPAKFQFISIDDEELQPVENFLRKKKMAGWVGLDGTGGVFKAYGVEARPTTIIVDGNGKIVAVTEIDSLSAADLKAVAEGKPVVFKEAMEITEISASTVPDVGRALFAVSVSKAAPDAKMSLVNHPPTGSDVLGEDADSLLTDVFNVFGEQYFVKGPLPEGRYDLRVNLGDVPQAVNDPVVQQAVLAALHLQIERKTLTKPVYVLRAMDKGKTLLSGSASTHGTKRAYWHGKFILMNGTMDDLAYVLGTGLENLVVNETGVEGKYDARFEVPGGGVEGLNVVLREKLGLELVPGTQEMPITVFELSEQTEKP